VSVVVEAPLEERERELDVLRAALERATGGEGAGVLVEGPPGIGKTRVLSWARRYGGDERMVLTARASELEREFAFAVVRQLLEPPLRAGDRAELLAGAAALAEPVLAGGEMTDPAVALHGLYWLLANLAAQRPVLVLVDDAHWADAPSLRWLAYLAQRLDGLAVTLVAACRPAQAGDARDVLDALAANPVIEVVHPAALGTMGVARVVERALGGPAEPEFVEACRAVTGGNPFLLGELVRELTAARVAPIGGNAGVVSRQSSRTVSRAALARLRRLPAAANALARAIAVLGDGTDVGFAARLAGLDADAASAAADALAAAWIVAPGRPLAFAHPLV
jgi:predicted ATPase